MHIIYVTMPNSNQAKIMARSLLAARLAACINIINNVESLYIWEDKIEENNEVLLIIKSHSKLLSKLVKAIEKQHPYQCPAIEIVKIADANKDFIKWLETSLKLA